VKFEILEILDRELIASGQKNKINGGVVLTGGTALLANIVELAEQIFDLPVRIGYPSGLTGKVEELYNPRCTTAAGLVVFGRKKQHEMGRQDTGVFGRMRDWIKKIM